MITPIELLSPARDADCGIEAIRHGADAVYIGGPGFGARAAAGNPVDDIGRLCAYAHRFGARVYVTLNTILYDEELPEVREMACRLHEAGADALIVQDLALLKMDLPPTLALHASTQTDIRTPEKAEWLERKGFRQLVLARELSLAEIRAIRNATSVPLEAFVHGALCVSYSGQCYASEHCFGRSANRGCCAQFCRLAFDLLDGEGHVAARDRHLLSLRDMHRAASLEAMMEAGISSFKIEGRLKAPSYVKNVTAYYRRCLDKILEAHPDRYVRSSYGEHTYTFTPDPARSFNRGFTDYFLHGRTPRMASTLTPKSLGSKVGTVVASRGKAMEVRLGPGVEMAAGDGICFVGKEGKLAGFRVNNTEACGRGLTRLLLREKASAERGTPLYRNHDAAFEKLLSRPSATRRLRVDFRLCTQPAGGFRLSATDETGRSASATISFDLQPVRQDASEQLRQQLSRLGDTDFVARNIDLGDTTAYFLPVSLLAAARRNVIDQLTATAGQATTDIARTTSAKEKTSAAEKKTFSAEIRTTAAKVSPTYDAPPTAPASPLPFPLDYSANVANHVAEACYLEAGAGQIDRAFELTHTPEAALMTCRYCLRYEFGLCPKHQRPARPLKEPLRLRLSDGRTFRLHFDCRHCEMKVLPDAP